jgi:hypothetical protein
VSRLEIALDDPWVGAGRASRSDGTTRTARPTRTELGRKGRQRNLCRNSKRAELRCRAGGSQGVGLLRRCACGAAYRRQAVVFGTVEGGVFDDTPSFLDRFLLYESTDCSGPALMTSDVQTLLPHALVHGSTAYYPSGSPSSMVYQSYLSAGHVQTDCPGQFSPPDVCCLVALPGSVSLPLAPALPSTSHLSASYHRSTSKGLRQSHHHPFFQMRRESDRGKSRRAARAP